MPSRSVYIAYSSHEFLSDENLAFADEAVASVFSVMLGLETELVPAPEFRPCHPCERTAIVGFSGSLRGTCELRLSGAAASTAASAMLSGSQVFDEGDIALDDAAGELCNMIAGGWKNSIPALASTCALAPPTVISGCDYKIHSNAAARIVRAYKFAEHTLQLTLRCLEPKPQ